MTVLETYTARQLEKTAEALRRNRMEAYIAATKEEVPALVASLLHEGDTVAVGGSESLKESGVMALLRSGAYRFLDRYTPGLTPEQTEDIYRQSFFADAYLCSSNAVTLRGELYNVDGNANRVAAMCYGPKSVILVVGCNKIVPDLKAAEQRVKMIAAPMNTVRLKKDTPCAADGRCAGLYGNACTDGCKDSDRICCSYLVMGQQRTAGRVKVILVGEPLGY